MTVSFCNFEALIDARSQCSEQDIAVDYCSNVMKKAVDNSAKRGLKNIQPEDILFTLRNVSNLVQMSSPGSDLLICRKEVCLNIGMKITWRVFKQLLCSRM